MFKSVAFLIIGLFLLLLIQAFYSVPIHRVAVITLYGQVMRVSGPGMQWHIPFLETVNYIPANFYEFHKKFKFKSELSDNSTCDIEGEVIFRVDDPVRNYHWSKQRSLDLSRASYKIDISKYTEATTALRVYILKAVKSLPIGKIKNGAIEYGIYSFKSPTFEDGTKIVQARATYVSCSDVQKEKNEFDKRVSQTKKQTLQKFSKFENRLSMLERDQAIQFILPEIKLITSDNRIVIFEKFTVFYRIVDEKGFQARFGKGEFAKNLAQDRVTLLLETHMRAVLARLLSDELGNFDTYSILEKNTEVFSKALKDIGMEIVDLGGTQSGYRLQP